MPSMSLGRVGVAATGVLALVACATTPPAPPAPAEPRRPAPGFAVEKMREELQVAPWELAFSGVRGEGGMQETVTVRNLVDHPIELRSVQIVGEGARLFSLLDVPVLPAVI